MLSVDMLSVDMLSVDMPNVVLLSVVAPTKYGLILVHKYLTMVEVADSYQLAKLRF